jgi:hypothetical protein
LFSIKIIIIYQIIKYIAIFLQPFLDFKQLHYEKELD